MDKRYDHSKAEQRAICTWQEEQTYAMAHNIGPLYTIDTPPPTVSGNLHVGHLFSYTQTDILARYYRMAGYSVFYPFGFDDNGLPTERYVEKNLKINPYEVGRSNFIKLCLEQTEHVEQQFKSLWQKMGLSVDWKMSYSTISEEVRKISQESFIRLFKDGFVYQGQEPALYCPTCRTSVAQAELDDSEQTSFFNDIAFADQNGNPIIIGTTRPELLSSCVALFYHPDDTRYHYLQGTLATVPLTGEHVPILTDEQVDKDKGTGLVMCCTFGDKKDVYWFKKHNLVYKKSLDLDGKFVDKIAFIGGLKPVQARALILEELKKSNALVAQQPIVHTVHVHERCKKPIEFAMFSQWFLRILDYKKTFLDIADEIDWYPYYMKSRYLNWVENISWDWCLSRQRFFGIPFPVWHCRGCSTILLAPIKDLPIDPLQTPYPGTTCPECKSNDIVGDTDVMDTWNTSSLTPYICFKLLEPDNASVFSRSENEQFIPMSMRPQAHDIIRTWAFYTIVKAWMHNKTIPWKSIVISGHVLSDNKEKLSKSKGNDQLSPFKLLEQYSADVIRYWTASGGLGNDITFSQTQLRIGQRLVTKLWNAFRFISDHMTSTPHEKIDSLGIVNEWILSEATLTFAQYSDYLKKNEFSRALDVVETFFWKQFCDTYLEFIKEQVFNPDRYTLYQVHATRWTVYWTGFRILQWFGPYVPFVTETLYQELYKKHSKCSSLHQTKFKTVQYSYSFPQALDQMSYIITLNTQVRKLKTAKQVSLKTGIETLVISGANVHQQKIFKSNMQLLKGITGAQTITVMQEKGTCCKLTEDNGNWNAQVVLDDDNN
jgi:valyl-tRNA synthetase